MSASEAVRDFIKRVSRRIWLELVMAWAAAGLSIAILIGLAFSRQLARPRPWFIVAGAAGLLIGGVIGWLLRLRVNAALRVESKVPESRNLLLTAFELDDPALDTPSAIREVVVERAAVLARQLDPGMVAPVRRGPLLLAAVTLGWLGAIAAASSRPAETARRAGPDRTSAILSVDAIVTPPNYTGERQFALHNPARIQAVAGSIVALKIRASSDSVHFDTETLADEAALARDGTIMRSFALSADVFIGIEPRSPGHGVKTLIGLSATPDRPPQVKVTQPGHDLFTADINRSIDLAFDADDDFGLATLTIHVTKVSGSGERFTFVEDTIPVRLDRVSQQHWTGRATLSLALLKLEPGDVVVYKAVATDRRPGAPPAEADAWIVDITSPGMTPAAGFSMDDAENKYALSQQMVILKTERLIAASKTIAPDSVTSRAQSIAAEQRAVRAEFVFMMGGEVAEDIIAAAGLTDLNEEAEAAAEADIAAGRLQNHGRVALVQAVRFMSRASTTLNTGNPTKALAEEKAALAFLQQAFSRTRYLLRALTQRERLDLARRLTGSLADVVSDSRAAPEPTIDVTRNALRAVLADAASLAETPDRAARATALAQR